MDLTKIGFGAVVGLLGGQSMKHKIGFHTGRKSNNIMNPYRGDLRLQGRGTTVFLDRHAAIPLR
jgi:hypothetical protein